MAVPRTMQAERKPAKHLGEKQMILWKRRQQPEENQSDAPPPVRKNLKETVFFLT